MEDASRRRSSIGYFTVLGLIAVEAGPEGEAPRAEERVAVPDSAITKKEEERRGKKVSFDGFLERRGEAP
jgi:hypothetical protein